MLTIMDEELKKRFDEQDKKLDAIYRSSEKMRKIFLWKLIITIVMIVLPLIGLLVVIPKFLSTVNIADFKGLGGF